MGLLPPVSRLQNYKNKLGLEGLHDGGSPVHSQDDGGRAAKRLRLGSGGQLEGGYFIQY